MSLAINLDNLTFSLLCVWGVGGGGEVDQFIITVYSDNIQ